MSALLTELARCEADVLAFPGKLERLRARSFKAWRVDTTTSARQAHELPIEDADTLDEAMQIAASACQFRDGLMVLCVDSGLARNVLRVCQIKRESQRRYVRNPVTGAPEWQQQLYPVTLFEVDVAEFDPAAGPTLAAVCADPVRFDPTLVEG